MNAIVTELEPEMYAGDLEEAIKALGRAAHNSGWDGIQVVQGHLNQEVSRVKVHVYVLEGGE